VFYQFKAVFPQIQANLFYPNCETSQKVRESASPAQILSVDFSRFSAFFSRRVADADFRLIRKNIGFGFGRANKVEVSQAKGDHKG